MKYCDNSSKEKNTHANVFTKIYKTGKWGNDKALGYEGSSGEGSEYWVNKYYINFIKKFIKIHKISSVVDLGCGSFKIGRKIYDTLNVKYTGYDTYKDLIISHNKKFSKIIKHKTQNYTEYKFEYADLSNQQCRNSLKSTDLCIIKDVLQHWSNKDIIEFMDFLIKSNKYKYILLINCYKSVDTKKNLTKKNLTKKNLTKKNITNKESYNEHNSTKTNKNNYRKDIEAGDFNFLSIDKHPLNKYKGKIDNTEYFGQKLGEYYTKEISVISKLPVIYFKW